MTDSGRVLNKQERKKARRKDRKSRERQAHRDLDEATAQAVDLALGLAPEVARSSGADAVRVVDIELASLSEAQYVRKRINDALNVGEWLIEIQITLWQRDDPHLSWRNNRPLSAAGETTGFELRLQRRSIGD